MKLRAFWFVLALGLLPFTPSLAEEYSPGIDYEEVTPPMTGGDPEVVEVYEFFWYGCPHCYQFEPYVEKWLEQKPEGVELVRVPAIFDNPQWELHARAYYTAEVLGQLEAIHGPLFDALHKDKKRVYTEKTLRDFFAARGIDGERFDKTFRSFAVESKVRRARELTQRAGLDGVPAVIVDGRYRVTGTLAGSYKKMITTADYLARELAEQGQ